MEHDEPARTDRTRSRAASPAPDLAMLVAAMADGSEAALAQLFGQCFDRVYGIVFRILPDPADAEEVAVEVFHQAWRSARAYDASRGTVPGWLASIAWSRHE